MGIDVYLRWNGQTADEENAQYTGFSVTSGHVGYLREAYHGGPYATQVLMPEGFEENGNGAVIPAATLRARLPEVVRVVKERAAKVYKEELTDASPEVLAFVRFVEMAERLEGEGKAPRIEVSY